MDDFIAIAVGLAITYILGVHVPTFDPAPYVRAHLEYRSGR